MGIGHSRDLLPTVISGGANFGIRHQGHLNLPKNTPLSNLWFTMMDRIGVEVPQPFHDSTGIIQELVHA